MSDKVSLELMEKHIAELRRENDALRSRLSADPLKTGGGSGTSDGMDLIRYRLDQFEKHADAADARMARVEDKLTAIQLTLAGVATKDAIRNWSIAVIAIVLATGTGIAAVLLQSSGNQLASFQAGLSAIQAVVATHDLRQPPSTGGPTHP